MKYIVDHADEIDKLIKVKAQVSEVKSIMLENIDKVNQLSAETTQLLSCTINFRSIQKCFMVKRFCSKHYG